MIPFTRSLSILLGAVAMCAPARSDAADAFRVATYNLENYLEAGIGTRPAKSAAGKAKILEGLRMVKADVLALQEMGTTNALFELRESLRAEGLDYPFWEHITGSDTNIHVAVLSKFPIVARHPHTNDSFLLFGRRFRVSRGFAEVDIQVGPSYRFTLITAHLKSRRPVPDADEAELREQEALLLREKIDARLLAKPNLNLIVLGDFNDNKDAPSTRALLGRGRSALIDTRLSEQNGDEQPDGRLRSAARTVTWTHYYGKEDTYSRIDYILLSSGMAREWNQAESYVLALPNWGVASDHRPLVATFSAADK